MLTTLFHPKELGGRFCFDPQGHSTVFTELIQIFASSSTTASGEVPSVHQRLMDFQDMAPHLVIDLGMPIHITDKLFQVNKRDKPSPLLDLAKQLSAWTAFVAFAPYFREQDILHADWPSCVQPLLPYISDDELAMAEAQRMQTLDKIRQMNAYFHGQGLYDHQGQIFAQILTII